MDHAHPNCPNNAPNCMPPPFDGDKLQIMPWPEFRLMTDRQLTAVYTYLSAIPCLEGGPGEPSPPLLLNGAPMRKDYGLGM